MINELLAFSLFTQFRLVLLRKPARIYHNDIEELKARGVEIFITPFQAFPSLKRGLFSVYFILKNISCFLGFKNFVFGIKSIHWFTILRRNIIPSHSSVHAQFATQASIIALLYKNYLKYVEYSFTFHAHDIYFPNRWFRLLVNESEKAISISEYNINYVENRYLKYNTDKINLSRLGVFLPKIRSTQKHDLLTIGFLSWWEEKKGLLILLNAFKSLIDECRVPIRLILAGDGPMHNHVINFIKDNKLHNYIEVRGKIFGKNKGDFYKEIDIFTLPSIASQNDMDGIPVVLMEAVSFGVPIISTNLSGIPEICKNNYNGFLIPSNDITALKKAILKFYYMDDVQFQQFRRRAYKSSRDYDIIENSKNKLEKLRWDS